MLKEVIKRNGRHTKFVANKINIAIQKANNEVSILDQASDEDIKKIVKDIKSVKDECIHIEVVQDLVETGLMQAGKFELAKKYMLYRYKHKLARDLSEAEASVLGILDGTNLGVIDENSNKNSYVNSTQRDLMAGEVSRTIAKKILLPDDIRKADEDMEIHWHDIDYTVQSMINCFGRETRFLTTSGVRSFEDFNDGDIVEVFSHTGAKRRAVVHNYGRQKLYNITFKRGKDSFRTIRATRNHRWLLLHGSQTTNLSVGDAIATPPVIDSFNLAECDPYLYEYWCIGFALGDGSDYDNSRYGQSGFGISVRLCGRKKQYNDIFDRAGFNCTQPESLHGDYRVYMPKYSKEAFLRNKSWRSLSVEQQIALFNGYICADGEFRGKDYPTGISTINSDIESMVYELAELSGYYIGASRVVTGSTNFVEERKPLTHIQFAREFYCRHPYKCYSIEEDVEEDVWCLEVEEDKSFLLEGGLVTGNCCLINIKSILDDGTVMSDYLIASPKSFRTACSIVTQVVAIIASNQYGGQSIAIKHLGKYLAISRERFRIENRKRWEAVGLNFTEDQLNAVTEEQLKYELEQGVQTIQYQFQTLVTTNGQSPFVTLFMQLDENDPYLEETAMIIEEILKQRLKGVMNKDGKYITPSFPKLIYVLDENNCLRGGKYDYLTHLAAKCTIKRSYPDYISAKKMREQFDGEVFSCMGCVDGEEVITYKLRDSVFCESFSRAWIRLYYEFKAVPQQEDSKNLYIDTPGVEIWDNKEEAFVPCYRFIRNVQDKWVNVKLSNGRHLSVTDNHPFETENRGVVLARDLAIDDVIRIDRYSNFCTGSEDYYTEDQAWLLGLALCDSSFVTTLNISLGLDELDIQQRAVEVLKKEYNGTNPYIVEQRRGVKGNYNDIRVSSTEVNESGLRAHLQDFDGIKKVDRHIPNKLWNCSREVRLAFLGGIIDADGYISNSSTISVINIGSTNQELAIQEMLLAQSLGYPARMYLNHYSKKHPEKIRFLVSFDADYTIKSYIHCQKKLDNLLELGRSNNSNYYSDYSNVTELSEITVEDYSYDVTTESEHFTVSGVYSHNCRSFLSPWKKTEWYVKMMHEPESEIGKYLWEGRFNQGVVTINLPQIGIIADHDMSTFWSLLDERLAKCYKALLLRHKLLEDTLSDTSPLHWQFGGIARLPQGESINKLLHDGFSTLSLGYIGIYETVYAMLGVSHTTPEGKEFALKIMHRLADACETWKKETNLGFGLYGTPAESLCYKFCKHDAEKFGIIENVTDKGYYTNSYHIDVREEVNAFEKFEFESEFQPISSGGCISYVEIPNLEKNQPVVEKLITYIYDHVRYGEFNSKSDYCFACGFQGQIDLNKDNQWECPCCHNKDMKKMYVSRRTCGYLGSNEWNEGKRREIGMRVEHL